MKYRNSVYSPKFSRSGNDKSYKSGSTDISIQMILSVYVHKLELSNGCITDSSILENVVIINDTLIGNINVLCKLM